MPLRPLALLVFGALACGPLWAVTSPTMTACPTQTPAASPSPSTTVTPTATFGTGSYALAPAVYVGGSSGNSMLLSFNTQSAFWPISGGILSIFVPSTLGLPDSGNFYGEPAYSAYILAPLQFNTPTPGPVPNSGMVVQVEMGNLVPYQTVVFSYGNNPPPGQGFFVALTSSPQSLILSSNPSDPNFNDPGGLLTVQPTILVVTPRNTSTITPTSTGTATPATATPTRTASPTSTISPTWTITPLGKQVGSLYSYPNPFDIERYNKCTFRFPSQAQASITVFNLVGQPVREIPIGDIHAQAGWAIWDGEDDYNRRVAGGIYFVRVKGGTTMVRKFTVLK